MSMREKKCDNQCEGCDQQDDCEREDSEDNVKADLYADYEDGLISYSSLAGAYRRRMEL